MGPLLLLVSHLMSCACPPAQLARHTDTNELVAIKFIERGDRVNRYVEAEILNHRMLRHPHVIEFKEVRMRPSARACARGALCVCSRFEWQAGWGE